MDDMYNEGQNHYASQGKLVLSPHSDGNVPPYSMNEETSFMPAGNDQTAFMAAGAPPFAAGENGYPQGGYPRGQRKKGLFQKLRTDPAYQVLAVAIVVVLIASGSLVAFAATGMMGTGPNHNSPNQPLAKVQSTPVTHATQAPTAVPTLTVAPTPVPTQAPAPVTTQPTQGQGTTRQMGNITVAFSNAIQQVTNGQNVTVPVQTNQAGATLQFQVTYMGATGTPVLMQQAADANGMATFNWTVTVFVFGNNTNNNVTAHLVVTAMNANGQTQQATMNVKVIVNNNNNNGGGN